MQIPDYQNAKVLVVGDVMLDRYWTGDASRVSPEAPVPVVHIDDLEDRPGGAGNVALNIAALGGQVSLLSLVGEDEAAKKLKTILSKAGVQCEFTPVLGADTITKLRVMSRHQQMIRLDFEDGFTNFKHQQLVDKYTSLLDGVDLVVFSDYAKGCLSEVQLMITIANQKGIQTLVDPKGSDFEKYRGATLLTPNESEFSLVAGKWNNEAEFSDRAVQLKEDINLEALLVTRSERGMALFEQSGELHIPTQAREVFDVTGAGDTVIATLAISLAAGESKSNAVKLANAAASVVVGKLGTATLSCAELAEALRPVHDENTGIISEAHLLEAVALAKQRGETIVMTNGCFDILHAGHVQYLTEAKKLGDRLIVAVNSDSSVKQLKGEGRPVNTLDQRMAVLSGLQSVDWVVDFNGSEKDPDNDSTPRDIICAVKPDILVKGGDYETDQVAGGECVQQIAILQFKADCSTSAVIKKIQKQ